MSTEFGSGIYLSSEKDVPPTWDMDVTSSGDIRTVSGSQELEKDVALSTTIRIGEEIGSRITPVVRNRIRARVLDALDDEVRINSVLVLDVSEVANRDNLLEIVVEANTVQDESTELVFEVTR